MVKRSERGNSVALCRCVRRSRNKEAVQLRSLMTGSDFVNVAMMWTLEFNMLSIAHVPAWREVFIHKNRYTLLPPYGVKMYSGHNHLAFLMLCGSGRSAGHSPQVAFYCRYPRCVNRPFASWPLNRVDPSHETPFGFACKVTKILWISQRITGY